jgi:Tfp pilus assembly protein PilX
MRNPQRGMALIVGLILLALMTVMAITGFNIGRTSLDIVGNMQGRQEVLAAANSAIQEALSTTRLFEAPGSLFLDPCDNEPNTRCFDTNGDEVDDIKVVVGGPDGAATPECIQAQTIPTAVLDLNDSSQTGCTTGVGQTYGVEGATTGASLCAGSVWEIVATATDLVTESEVVVTEGAAVRVSTDDVGTNCPDPV